MRIFGLLLLTGCGASWTVVDVDSDGFTPADGDCWENSIGPEGTELTGADIHPGASETWYDGIDQDCDGGDDFDKDGDGVAAVQAGGTDCWDDPDVLHPEFTAVAGMAQPGSADVFPGAVEVYYDDVEQDCLFDGDFDQDGDGYASASHPDRDGVTGDDCYDAVDDVFENEAGFEPIDVNPAATDLWYDGTDADCGGNDDFDQDGDGFSRDEECDDADALVFPNPDIPEVWYNGVDENCDGNDGDQDRDGYYVEGYTFQIPPAYSGGDCWDDPALGGDWQPLNGFEDLLAFDVHPTAPDRAYDGLDQDCAGGDDFDADGDGYETDAYSDGFGVGDDCDDADALINPGAVDIWYDGPDSDCAGNDDYDQDGDTFTSSDYAGEDCDDTDAAVNPDAREACGNATDEDCNGSANDRDALGCSEFFPDADGDGYGDDGASACFCEGSGTYTAVDDSDCDDTDPLVSPGVAKENCGTTYDDDCDGITNEINGTSCTTWYVDVDSDGYGTTTSACICASVGTYDATNDTDCDDTSASVNPGAVESCNGADDDCDGSSDEGLPLYYADEDGDGFGTGTGSCTSGSGYASTGADCDDTDEDIYPGAAELCDGIDNGCVTGWTASDEDGVASLESGGVWTDITSLTAGTPATPLLYTLPSTGTLWFCDGTWYTRLLGDGDTVDIVGLNGAATTILSSNASGPVASITAGDVTFTGVTITGGSGSGSGTTYGGGIVAGSWTVRTTPNVTLEECVVTGNSATNGGGIAANIYGYIALIDTAVYGNDATDGGGGWIDEGKITCTASSASVVAGFYDNTATDEGGGIYIADNDSDTRVGTFVSTLCDFGSAAGSDDNSPNDVETTAATSYDVYESDESFTCTKAAGCSP